jgi:hypothetical protein
MKTKLFSSILAIGTLSSGVLLNVTPAAAGGGSFKGNCSNGGFPRQHQPHNHHGNQPKPEPSHHGDNHGNQPKPEPSHHGDNHANQPKPEHSHHGDNHANQPKPEPSHHGDNHFNNQPSYHKATLGIDVKPAQTAYKYDYSRAGGTHKGH